MPILLNGAAARSCENELVTRSHVSHLLSQLPRRRRNRRDLLKNWVQPGPQGRGHSLGSRDRARPSPTIWVQPGRLVHTINLMNVCALFFVKPALAASCENWRSWSTHTSSPK